MPYTAFVHPFSPAGRADPARSYRWLHAHSPVHSDTYSGSWLLSGYRDCVAALRDPRLSATLGQRERTRDDALPPSMLTTDGPEHTRLRAPGALLLGPAAARALAGRLGAEVEAVLAGVSGRPVVEAGADLGEPFALGVFATLLAIPPAERRAFGDLAGKVSVNLDPLASPPVAAAGRRAMGALTSYLDGHLTRLTRPSTGTAEQLPVTRLAQQAELGRAELLGVLGLAVVGGYQPIAEFVGNALACLLPATDALSRLRAAVAAGDDAVPAAAVEEVLRLASPIPFVARTTTEPVRLSGATIPAGARVLILLAAANRDPTIFPRPDDLNLDRGTAAHLGLGGGAHLCLAAPLVRLAGRLLLSGLVGRFPELTMQPPVPRWDTTTLLPRRIAALRVHLC
jgi:cytochrome P450